MTLFDQEESIQALGKSEVDLKIERYEQKIDIEMRPQLQQVLAKREQIYAQLGQYLQLKNTLEMIREQKLKKFDSYVDLGCNIFVQTEVKDLSRIMVALTKDFFVEMSQEEALGFIEKKEKVMNEKIKLLTKKSCEIKAHILFIQEAIRELLKFTPGKTPKQRQFL
uniref:Uncharacterized protein n=1 Tax=Strombidium rassoulzadegani TaxID=1082188 RepID=A0A7S3CJF0_9SPIT|mmetsp:Transcript_13200/g.22387  ORF Transcript_13200/g.22387 Transcript_13200/m.22387 type:complete len:166 (+) Transcript_13200:39-536(+)